MSLRRSDFDKVVAPTGADTDRRAAAQRAEEERAQLRRTRIEAQSSPFAAPSQRVRLWEELHGLRLPESADHRLVRVIASSTGLTIREVHDEQLRRRGESPEVIS